MNNSRGFVLVLVLVVTALLTGLVTVFINEVYLETGSSRNSIDAAQGSLFAEGGITGAQQLLTMTLNSQSYSTLSDHWAKPLVFDEEQGQLRISIEEENSKLNLNAIAFPNGTNNDPYRDIALRLFKQLKLPLDPLDAIADWIDEEETPKPGGAEADWYLSRKQPYRPRNKPLATVEELKRIKGIADLFDRIRPFITVYGDQPGAAVAPININTASRELLLALDERMTETLAERIIEHRATTPFKHPAELGQVPGMQQIATALLTRISTKGSVYRVRAEALVNGTTRTIEAVVRIGGGSPSILYWREY